MKTPGFHVIDDVVLRDHSCCPLVEVDPPAAVIECVDVMNQVVMQHASWRKPERVNPAHVAEDALADLVNVIPCHRVVMRCGFVISPRPTHAHAGVIRSEEHTSE